MAILNKHKDRVNCTQWIEKENSSKLQQKFPHGKTFLKNKDNQSLVEVVGKCFLNR